MVAEERKTFTPGTSLAWGWGRVGVAEPSTLLAVSCSPPSLPPCGPGPPIAKPLLTGQEGPSLWPLPSQDLRPQTWPYHPKSLSCSPPLTLITQALSQACQSFLQGTLCPPFPSPPTSANTQVRLLGRALGLNRPPCDRFPACAQRDPPWLPLQKGLSTWACIMHPTSPFHPAELPRSCPPLTLPNYTVLRLQGSMSAGMGLFYSRTPLLGMKLLRR